MTKVNPLLKLTLLTLFSYLSFLIIRPFFSSIVLGLAFAIIFHPLSKWIKRKLRISSGLASFVTVVLTVLFIILPLAALITLIGIEATEFIRTIDFEALQQNASQFQSIDLFGYQIELARFQNTIIEGVKSIGAEISTRAPAIASSIWNSLFLFFVFLLLFFYFLKDSKKLLQDVRRVLPYSQGQQEALFNSFHRIAHTVFYGNLLSALIAGVIAYFGFWIFGFKGVLIWALLATILSFIPTAGTLLLYMVGVILLYFTSGWLPAFLMVAYFILMELILREEVIKGKILEDRLNFHPILVFFALAGGVSAFGSLGIIYGPLIITFLMTLYDFYVSENNRLTDKKKGQSST